MNQSTQIANQFREAQLNGTWIATNLKSEIAELTWQQATTKISSLNTIAALTFHLNYYVAGLIQVFEGGTLDIRDKYSFDCPLIENQVDWEKLRDKSFADAERFAELVAKMPDVQLGEGFVDIKYGDYRRNIHGVIEHTYYHLGQIVLIKKLIVEDFRSLTNPVAKEK